MPSAALTFNPTVPAIVLQHLNTLLDKRDYPKTLCPSEVARALSNNELAESDISSWHDLMPDLRVLCFTLRDQGKLEILQKGEVQTRSMDEITGPIRIRRIHQ